MRGTLGLPGLGGCGRRIIPAHAGNSHRPGLAYLLAPDHPRACGNSIVTRDGIIIRSDHPRVCGELPCEAVFFSAAIGSSPRMRGTHCDGLGSPLNGRIIPAHAGNSYPSELTEERDPDHPRACGELGRITSSGLSGLGSSPRMRGTHVLAAKIGPTRRIIPAHAGNSLTSR